MVFGLNRRNKFQTIRRRFEAKGRVLQDKPTPGQLKTFKERQRVEKAVLKMSPEDVKEFQRLQQERKKERHLKQFKGLRTQVRTSAGEFATLGQVEPDFSTEQKALHSMFGGGGKVWGRSDSEPVTLHHDLNPRQRGDFGTAEMFGF